MRLGNVVAALISGTLVFWRVVVVAMNAIWAVSRDRWIDASFWSSEDPIERIEVVITRFFVISSATDHTKLYLLEVTGVVLWSVVALLLFRFLNALPLARHLNTVRVTRWQLLLLITVALAGAYVGGLYRERLVAFCHFVRAPWAIESTAMILAVVAAGTAPLALAARLVYATGRDESRAH